MRSKHQNLRPNKLRKEPQLLSLLILHHANAFMAWDKQPKVEGNENTKFSHADMDKEIHCCLNKHYCFTLLLVYHTSSQIPLTNRKFDNPSVLDITKRELEPWLQSMVLIVLILGTQYIINSLIKLGEQRHVWKWITVPHCIIVQNVMNAVILHLRFVFKLKLYQLNT